MSDPYHEREDYYPYQLNQDYSRYTNGGGRSNTINDYTATRHSQVTDDPNNTKYVQKIIQSGYIVGPPVAYTHQPSLPANFHAFSTSKPTLPVLYENNHTINQSNISPSNSRINIGPKILINSPQHRYPITTQSRSYSTNQPPPSIIVHPPPPQQIVKTQQVVSKTQYDRSLIQSKNWQNKYNELYVKYISMLSGQGQQTRHEQQALKQENYRLKQRIRDLQNRQHSYSDNQHQKISELVQKYKQSTLKECFLLLDRYRLELKQNER